MLTTANTIATTTTIAFGNHRPLARRRHQRPKAELDLLQPEAGKRGYYAPEAGFRWSDRRLKTRIRPI
jgi:hypothetical protein